MSAGDPILSALTEQTAPAGTDYLPLARGAATLQKVTLANVKTLVLAGSGSQTGLVVIIPSGDTSGAIDAAAIQAALNTGNDVYLSAGTYFTNATLNLTALIQNGQKLYGAGATSAQLNGGNSTIIRPTAAVAVAILIDGTGVGGYIQNSGIADLTIDMVNMADASTSMAIRQVQAYDCYYTNVRAVNYATQKVSWQFDTGAYVTVLTSCQGGLVRFNGASLSNATTTVTLNNCDFTWIDHTFYVNVTIVGGAIQRPYDATVPIIFLPIGVTPYGYLPNTTGLYAAVMSKIDNALNFSSIGCDWEQAGGYPATYNDGTHGTQTLIRVVQVTATAVNTKFINAQFAGCYIYDLGVNTSIDGYQGTGMGFTGGKDYHFGDLPTSANVVGFTDFANYFDHGATQTYIIKASDGSAAFRKQTLKPAADADQVLTVTAAGGTNYLDVSTVGGGLIAVNNGAQFNGYTDLTATLSFSFSAATGLCKIYNAGTETIRFTGATGTMSLTSGYYVGGVNVVGARRTGWTAPTGTISRATFDQSTVTLPQLAQAVAALITDLTTHGLVGP